MSRSAFGSSFLTSTSIPYYRVFHTTPQHDGSANVEQQGEEYHFVVTERGSEFERRRTTDPEEILYWLLDGVTQVAATNYELKNRIEGKGGREIWFRYQEKLLFSLKPGWGIRKQQEHFRILRDHPLRNDHSPANHRLEPTLRAAEAKC